MMPSRIGKYEVERRLGVGGMGSVYLARDPGLERLVAIKLLKDEFEDDREIRERFAREARSVARLRHRNIIIVYEIGEAEGRPFMAMEYIAGETLTQFLRRVPPAPLGRRLSIIEDLCDGLAHAHSTGIIHRDVKPANIMLDPEGVVKILDFGIARLDNSGMTQAGMMMGTVNYMSPEQIAGHGVDHRTDVFATGAVLYEAIALEQALPGGIDTGVLNRILNEGPVPLTERVPDVDPELAGIVEHALARDPARRYQDLRVMRRELARVRRRLTEATDHGEVTSRRPSTTDREHDRRLDPERIARLREQQVEESLRFGEEAFARGDHDAAVHHAERAAMADPNSRAAFDLIDKAKFAIEAKAIRQLLAKADRLLSEGHVEDAGALVDGASSFALPDLSGASELRDEIRRIAEQVAAAREREQRILVTLGRARASMANGGYDTALRAVYEVLALDPERAEARQLEQEAKARLEAQREHERVRNIAYERLQRAAALADAGKFDEAAEIINAVTPPSDTVRVAAAEALATIRKRQRQAAHAAILAEARTAFEQGQLEPALSLVDSIPAGDRTDEIRMFRAAVDDAIRQQRELERKRQALEEALVSIESLIEAGDLAKAFERVDYAAKLGIADGRIAAMRQRIAELAIVAQERRQQEARDRMAANRVEAARQLHAAGDGYAAIALLERAGSGHPLIDDTLRDIRSAVAEHEKQVLREAELRRQEEDARRRAELEAARQLEEERQAEERQRLAAERIRREEEARQQAELEAARLLEEERKAAARQQEEEERRRRDVEARQRAELEAARQLEEQRKAAEKQRQQEEQRLREEERRRQLEEAAARERDEQAATLVAHARGLAGSGQLEEAVTLLRGAPAHTLTRATLEELNARRVERERQHAREARRLERQQRRAATVLALHRVAGDRRVHLAGVAILAVAMAATVWQLWPNDDVPASTSVVNVTPTALPPAAGNSDPSPPPSSPAETPSGARGAGTPPPAAPSGGASAPIVTRGTAAGGAPRAPIAPGTGTTTESPSTAPPAGGSGRSGGAAPPVAVPPVAAPTSAPPSTTPSRGEPQLPPPSATGPPPSPETPQSPPQAVQPNPPAVKPEVPPPLSNVEQDRSAIDQLLNEYIAAYSRMDEGRIRAIDPSFQQIQGRALIKSVTLVLPQRSITVSPDGQSAVLTATGSFNYVWNRSGFPPSSPTKLTWNLRKQGTTWTVVR